MPRKNEKKISKKLQFSERKKLNIAKVFEIFDDKIFRWYVIFGYNCTVPSTETGKNYICQCQHNFLLKRSLNKLQELQSNKEVQLVDFYAPLNREL